MAIKYIRDLENLRDKSSKISSNHSTGESISLTQTMGSLETSFGATGVNLTTPIGVPTHYYGFNNVGATTTTTTTEVGGSSNWTMMSPSSSHSVSPAPHTVTSVTTIHSPVHSGDNSDNSSQSQRYLTNNDTEICKRR